MRHRKTLLLLLLAFSCALLKAKQAIDIHKVDSALHERLEYEDKDVLVKRMFANTAVDTSTQVVKEFKPKFETKYRSDEDFNYNQVNETYNYWQQLKKRLIAFLKKLFGYAPDAPDPEFITIVLKVISALAVIVVLVILIRIYIRSKNRSLFGKKNDKLTININDSEQLIQLADFSTLIAEYEKNQAYRTCVRLYFLWVLKSLKDKNAIQWLPDKTNSAYANGLQSSNLKQSFEYLAYIYEYVWYGEFELAQVDYSKAKEAFEHFIQKGVNV